MSVATWVWLILAFLGGWATCWYLYRAVVDELDRRKQGIEQ